MTTSDFAIETEGLTKVFDLKTAVDSLTLRVPTGSVFAFLGRNGSGKTTTVRMLMGFMRPTRGSCRVLGTDSGGLTPSVRGRIGYMSESHPLHDWMTVREEGWFASQFHEGWNAALYESILRHFRIAEGTRVSELSRGERAGVSLAITLAPEPELLVLDDPAAGLDPVARRSLLEKVIETTRDSGRTVLLSSHQLDDVHRFADYVAILDYNRLRISGSIDDVSAALTQYRLTFAPGSMPTRLPDIPGLLSSKRLGDTLILTVCHPEQREGSAMPLRDMGAIAMEESGVPFPDAVMSYMGGMSEEHSPAGLVS
jgi:ABC-2 type transport system ATP-binding protein